MKFNLIKCDKCGTYINIKAKRKDGLPNLIQLVGDDGKVVSVCTECVNVLGKAVRDGKIEDREQFFEELEKNTEDGGTGNDR